MDADRIDRTVLTERQVEVLRLREEGLTQRAVAEELGTTPSNISRVERAAEENVEKARRTLDLVRLIRAPAQLRVEAGTPFDDVVDAVYETGDEAGVRIDYCVPELYSHLYTHLEDAIGNSELLADVELGITRDGDVDVSYVADAERADV